MKRKLIISLFISVLSLYASSQSYPFREYINRLAYLSISESPGENKDNLMNAIRYVNLTKNPALQRDVTRCFAQFNIINRDFSLGDSLLGVAAAHYRLASDSLGLAYTSLLNGYSMIKKGDKAGIPFLRQSMEYGYRTNNEVMIVRSGNSLGMALGWDDRMDEARRVYENAVAYCRYSGDSLMLSAALRGYAYYYRSMDDMKQVASVLSEAIRIDRALKRFNDFDRNLLNLASIMIELQYPKDAVEICKAAEYFVTRYHHDEVLFFLYANYATAYMHLDQISKAFLYARKALAEAEKAESLPDEATIEFLLGEIYYKAGNKEKASERYLKAASLYQSAGQEMPVIIFDRLGTLHMDKKEYHDAIKIFESGKELARINQDRLTYKDLNSGLAYAYGYTGNYEKAYECLRIEKDITDSLFNEEISTKISALDSNFEVEKKQYVIRYLDKENQLIAQRLRTNRILFILLIFVALALLFSAFLIYKNTRTRHRLEITERNMQALRSQMNPHFFFNVLNGIQAQIYKGEKAEAAKYLQKTAALMREILDSSIDDYISLENEVQMMTNYLVLQKMRMGETFDYTITFDADAEADWVLLPSMLAQPFIENALKHAFKGLGYKGILSVVYIVKANAFEIRIQDNGQGFKQETSASEHVSRALKITRQRLQMYEKKTRFAHSLDIQSSENGVTVVIRGFVKNE